MNVLPTGILEGYAWSDAIGWISFQETAGCPGGGDCGAHFNSTSGAVTGWARVLANDPASGFDGWISLSDSRANPTYGVTVVNGCDWSDYAWGSDVVGWIHFKGANYGVVGTGGACTGTPQTPPPPPPPPATCNNNGICEVGEDANSCPEDCGGVSSPPPELPPAVTQCSDGIDNDVPPDGKIDWNGGPNGELADPGCSDANDGNETDPAPDVLTIDSFTASPGSAQAQSPNSPVTVQLTAKMSGGVVSDHVNYSFWWKCDNSTTDVQVAEADLSCGNLPPPTPGSCVSNSVGAKCDDISSETQNVSHDYPIGSYIAKVIVERGTATHAEKRTIPPVITITAPPQNFSLTCDVAQGCPIEVVETSAPTAESSSRTIIATPFSNFTGTITLSIDSVTPPLQGLIPDFTDSSLSCSGGITCESSGFRISIPSNTPIGLGYKIIIKGTGVDDVTHKGIQSTVEVQLNVKEIRPEFREI